MNINVLTSSSPTGLVNFPANFRIRRTGMKRIVAVIILVLGTLAANAQGNPLSRYSHMGGSGGKDSLPDRKDDTISLTYRFLDSSRLVKIDSEVYNFYLRYPLQPTYVDFD